MPTEEGTMYSTGDASKFLGISQSSVINYINKGWLKPDLIMPSSSNRVGKRKFYKSTLIQFKEKLSKGEF